MDRETSGIRQVASKAFGYAALFDRFLHRRHFPDATIERINVLLVTLSAKRRNALTRTFRDKPHADLWKFVSMDELTPQSCIFDKIYHRCQAEPTGLINADYKAEFVAAKLTSVMKETPELKMEVAPS